MHEPHLRLPWRSLDRIRTLIPHPRGGAAVAVEGLHHSFGALEVIRRLDLHAAPARSSGSWGRRGAASRRCSSSSPASPSPRPARSRRRRESAAERLARCAYMPQRDLLLPWLRAIDDAPGAAKPRPAPRRPARRGRAAVRRLGLDGFQHALRASCPGDAPARRLRPHAARRQAGAAARQLSRGSTRSPAPKSRSGSPPRSPPSRAP